MSHRKWASVQPRAAHSADFPFPVRHPMSPHATTLSKDFSLLEKLWKRGLYATEDDDEDTKVSLVFGREL